VVGETSDDHQDGLALIGGQFLQSRPKIEKIHMALLIRQCNELAGQFAIRIVDFPTAAAKIGIEQVTQNREQPSRHVGALGEGADMGPSLDQGFLHEIIGLIGIAAERNGEGAQAWN
jgi:hypothetical protein